MAYDNRRPQRDLGPKKNEQIRSADVRLIDENGENVGVVSTKDAIAKAYAVGLDLLEISPDAVPPVAKIMDYGKWKYEEQKKKAAQKKKQKVVELKELKLRPNIEEHDYQVKFKAAEKFLGQGNKVKFSIRFRGREFAHQEMGRALLDKVIEDLGDKIVVEVKPKFEARQMMMIVAPVS